MKSQDFLIPVALVAIVGGGLLLIVALPGMIANRRKASHAARIRKLSVLSVVISTIGFLWGLLGLFRPGPSALLIGILPGAIVWFIALLWACFARPVDTVRGFEVRPLGSPEETKS